MRKFVMLVILLLFVSCGVRNTDSYGINGEWNRNGKEVVILRGRHGKLKGKNGAEVPIEVKYEDEGVVEIYPSAYSAAYLENFLPRDVAEHIYTNETIRQTSFLIRKIEDNRLTVMVKGWQVFYSLENHIYYVVPHLQDEVWKRIKD